MPAHQHEINEQHADVHVRATLAIAHLISHICDVEWMRILLKKQSVTVDAPRALCFEVVAAAGKTVEKRAGDEKLVEFRSEYRGREVVTTELVRCEPPDRIRYSWVKGPIPEVEEVIAFTDADGTTEMTYEGYLDLHRGFRGWVIGRLWIKPVFDRLVREHLQAGKQTAEGRAARTRVHRRQGT